VVVIFFAFVIHFLWSLHEYGQGFFTHPFYNPATFSFKTVFHGTSVAVLTYIGFDAISTFSEEVENPRRNIMLATVLVCLITGVLASLEVYAAQLVWRDQPFPEDKITSAFPLVAQTAGGYFLFQLVNFTILVANIGSGLPWRFEPERTAIDVRLGEVVTIYYTVTNLTAHHDYFYVQVSVEPQSSTLCFSSRCVGPSNTRSGTSVARYQSSGAAMPARLPPTGATDARYSPSGAWSSR